MAGFDLVPVDGGGPIHLPEGETLLGRGPFFCVNDKRVSRHHGLLENHDGKLRIKPTHVNPCFCQRSLDVLAQPLVRDQWHRLGHGDIFSLLPGKYMYKVVAVAGEDGTLKNSQALQDEEVAVDKTPPYSPEPDDDPTLTTGQGGRWTSHSQELESELQDGLDQKKPDDKLPTTVAPKQANGVLAEKDRNKLKVEPEKRVLPAWMMLPFASLTSPSSSKGAGYRGRRMATPMLSTGQDTAKRARATAPSSGEESEHREAEPMPRKRIRRKISDEDGVMVQSKGALKARQQVKPSNLEESEESDPSGMEVEEDREKTGGEDVSAANGSSPSTSRVENSEAENQGRHPNCQKVRKAEPPGSGDISDPVQSQPPLRTPCQYGENCYRKNPVHFKECSHPGDSDYEDCSEELDKDDEVDDGDQPECPYGTDCYRKNPLHRKEYRHTKKTRAKKPVSYNNKDEDDDDLGDTDSFINDESEDIDEDSDYEPPDSDDSGKEDLGRLKKEAKDFLKRK